MNSQGAAEDTENATGWGNQRHRQAENDCQLCLRLLVQQALARGQSVPPHQLLFLWLSFIGRIWLQKHRENKDNVQKAFRIKPLQFLSSAKAGHTYARSDKDKTYPPKNPSYTDFLSCVAEKNNPLRISLLLLAWCENYLIHQSTRWQQKIFKTCWKDTVRITRSIETTHSISSINWMKLNELAKLKFTEMRVWKFKNSSFS